MRHVPKSTVIPTSLAAIAPPASAADIDSDKYSGDDVKQQLITDHHKKCVYCECSLNGDYGHIEHFRPKGGYTVPPNKKLIQPGYYWLAYEWTNLLLSCSKCNTSYKKNNFALADESKRDIANKNIADEEPMLINPSTEDPAQYIEFHQHIAAPKIIDGVESARGRHTIELLRLNHRTDLVDNRRRKWESFNQLHKIRIVAQELIDTGIDIERGTRLLSIANYGIALMSAPDAEYSAMFI